MFFFGENTIGLKQESLYSEVNFNNITDEREVGSSFYDYGAPKKATFSQYKKGMELDFIEQIRP